MAKQALVGSALVLVLSSAFAHAQEMHAEALSEHMIAGQRAAHGLPALGSGFGPQSPRDISVRGGQNHRTFAKAPERQYMSLCNVHFHESAEHRGGEFTTSAGNGDGHGNGTGFKYDGKLTPAELAPVGELIGQSEHGDLVPGDTIEIHFVYSSADAKPGVTLSACLTEEIKNPQLRVEAVVAVLVNDRKALSMQHIAKIEQSAGFYQAPNIPDFLGVPLSYAGSTTGPNYNQVPSPFQVTWSVRPKVMKLDIRSVAAWLADNPFRESHAHGVRNLVTDPDLLSAIH